MKQRSQPKAGLNRFIEAMFVSCCENQENDLRKTSSIRISQHVSPSHGFQAFYLEKTIMCEPVCSTNHLSDMYRFLSQQNDSLTEMWAQTSSHVVLVIFFLFWVVWTANDASVSRLVKVDSSIQNTKGILTVVVYLLPICNKLVRKVGSNMKIWDYNFFLNVLVSVYIIYLIMFAHLYIFLYLYYLQVI